MDSHVSASTGTAHIRHRVRHKTHVNFFMRSYAAGWARVMSQEAAAAADDDDENATLGFLLPPNFQKLL